MLSCFGQKIKKKIDIESEKELESRRNLEVELKK
jgi:hypothetical protein